jgi:hypothetical protein
MSLSHLGRSCLRPLSCATSRKQRIYLPAMPTRLSHDLSIRLPLESLGHPPSILHSPRHDSGRCRIQAVSGLRLCFQIPRPASVARLAQEGPASVSSIVSDYLPKTPTAPRELLEVFQLTPKSVLYAKVPWALLYVRFQAPPKSASVESVLATTQYCVPFFTFNPFFE